MKTSTETKAFAAKLYGNAELGLSKIAAPTSDGYKAVSEALKPYSADIAERGYQLHKVVMEVNSCADSVPQKKLKL